MQFIDCLAGCFNQLTNLRRQGHYLWNAAPAFPSSSAALFRPGLSTAARSTSANPEMYFLPHTSRE